jgi:hypothetical protein
VTAVQEVLEEMREPKPDNGQPVDYEPLIRDWADRIERALAPAGEGSACPSCGTPLRLLAGWGVCYNRDCAWQPSPLASPPAAPQGWNEAIEAAAKVCESVNNYDNPMTALDCADAIRALKPPAAATEKGE